jgi:excisionase family DNA binding protein
MNTADRQRRHDEQWQHEVLDGLARMLDVLHDISDRLGQLAETAKGSPPVAPSPEPPRSKVLLSVKDLAELLGVPTSAVWSWRAAGHAPTLTMIGRRIYFRREDVDRWLDDQRASEGDRTRPWRESFVPGRIGSSLPASSQPPERTWCSGSHTEPVAASRWPGRAICRVCNDDVLVNRDGRLRKHYPRGW